MLWVEDREGRPARFVATYSHVSPRFPQRVQVGRFLEHLTLATAQASQLSRSLGVLELVDGGRFTPLTASLVPISAPFPNISSIGVCSIVLGVIGAFESLGV